MTSFTFPANSDHSGFTIDVNIRKYFQEDLFVCMRLQRENLYLYYNVALEFNIAPAENKNAFVASINFALEELMKRAGALNLQLSIVPSATFDRDQLRDPRAKVF